MLEVDVVVSLCDGNGFSEQHPSYMRKLLRGALLLNQQGISQVQKGQLVKIVRRAIYIQGPHLDPASAVYMSPGRAD